MSTIIGEDLMHVDASTQTMEIFKDHLVSNEISQFPTNITRPGVVASNDVKELSSAKKDGQSIWNKKKQIQILIDFQSPRIGLKEIPTNDFSKNSMLSKNFQLLTLDEEPIGELMLCKKCNEVCSRCRFTSNPVVRHLKKHGHVESTPKVIKKKSSYRKKRPLLDHKSDNTTIDEPPFLPQLSAEHKESNQSTKCKINAMQIASDQTKNLCCSNPPISPSHTFGAAELRAVAVMEIISSDQISIGKSISSSVIGVENEIQVEVSKP